MQSKKVLYLIALATSKFVGSAASFLEKSPHKEALVKAKPHPLFSKFTVRDKKKKPLSRRVYHALIAAMLCSVSSIISWIFFRASDSQR